MLATWASSPEKLHDPSRSSSGRDHSQARRRRPLLAISLAVR